MCSQKSTAAMALEPKRSRGKLRVAAIMDAGAAVFTEKGYDGATMSEIAARSNTAIGSLYRFFPTKDVLADAILSRYWALLKESLDGIVERAPKLSPDAIADALVDLMLDLRSDRSAAVALVDARSEAADKRSTVRNSIRERLATLLVAATTTLPGAEAERMAAVLLHLLKIAPVVAEEEAGAGQEALIAEARELVRLYVGRAFSKAAALSRDA
ncbi:TetR/AcrR family transcriptional regulator [Methylocella tundrae]|uniref:Transcriptional regulator, TetR family n=1 Tax=Methylocella tundrae TaxID=227605 RepID=A0A4U8YXV4_METTU|nr:TetR/AcrR family transcriptional regulator [Methylocella tundrae]WPP05804.1 TetR/AcrR family transcriptional regulator [Methylocella tundrae]VFU08316.1 Transcriptional regulator, TetR family [Methylocella tundrae]